MIEKNRDWPVDSCCDDRVDVGQKPVVRHALVVERRQHQGARKAELGGVPRQRDRVRQRRSPGADHQSVQWQANVVERTQSGSPFSPAAVAIAAMTPPRPVLLTSSLLRSLRSGAPMLINR